MWWVAAAWAGGYFVGYLVGLRRARKTGNRS